MKEPIRHAAKPRRELITFRIGEHDYAVDIMSVREIRGWSPVTPMPQTPDYMRGVINLRGAVLPIMDLAARLCLSVNQQSARSVIVVVNVDERLIGLLVDAVSDILTINEDAIQRPPDIAFDRARSYVSGLISMEDRMISVIAIERLLPEIDTLAA